MLLKSWFMQVCPADWQPGGKSIKTSAEGSMEYFSEAGKDSSHEEEFGQALKSIKSPKEFQELTQGDKPVVVDFYASWYADILHGMFLQGGKARDGWSAALGLGK